MDNKDRQIIQELQAQGRLTNQELADRVSLSPSPCLRRVKNLEKTGVIKGYTALVDQKAYGLPITSFLRVRLERHSDETVNLFEKTVKTIDNILDCYLMTGEADYLLTVVVESMDSYETFIRQKIQSIPGVASLDSSIAISVVKKSHCYPEAS